MANEMNRIRSIPFRDKTLVSANTICIDCEHHMHRTAIDMTAPKQGHIYEHSSDTRLASRDARRAVTIMTVLSRVLFAVVNCPALE